MPYDTRAHFLIDGSKSPDYTTTNRFRKILEDISSDLITQFVELLMQEGHVNLKNIYIDGTKIESAAGRYTFVWCKSVEKYQNKLKEQQLRICNKVYQTSF